MPVYMIQAGEAGPVKIGRSDRPDVRLRAIQTAHFAKLQIIRIIDGSAAEEAALHDHYRPLRQAGEWFEFCPTMMTIDPTTAKPRGRTGMSEHLLPARLPTPAEIAEQAKSAGLSIPALCSAAKVAPSTFYRWRDGSKVSVEVVQQFLDAIAKAKAAPAQQASD